MDNLKAVCDIFDIPYDAAGNVPRITVLGEKEVYVENFKTLLEYKKDNIKLKCKSCVIALSGADFAIKAIKEGCILVCGKIEAIKFI